MFVSTRGVERKRSTIQNTRRDEFLRILIERQKEELAKLVQDLAIENNPKLLSILKVENLFKKHIEFNSRSQLSRELKGSMKPPVLNTVIARLVSENKLVVNDDHSLTWIDTEGNKTLNNVFDKAVPF